MHDMDAHKTYREKAKWERHKDPVSYFEQILEAVSTKKKQNKKTAVRPLSSHLKTYPSKTNNTCRALLDKQDWAYVTFYY